ncbi:MAG: T9SS type A sorting domain-containing protein, partial [Ignavibacteria bacterium]|nr:T9SS type A sorting domain-containing protein [Ignavibacteria bacterium]
IYIVTSEGIWRALQNELVVTGINEDKTLPTKFFLGQNYPNPFNPSTTINYQLPTAGYVTLKVYDVLGREVATLVNEYQQAGTYNSQFAIRNYQLHSGVYFYRLKAGNFVQSKKMILLK